jgi:TolA-binding protein
VKKSRGKLTVAFLTGFLCMLLLATLTLADDNLYEQAMKAYFKKDYGTAAKNFAEFVEKKPDPYDYYLLGYSLYKLGRHPEAMKYFKEAYILDPNISPISVKEHLRNKM